MSDAELDQLGINDIRGLAMGDPQPANPSLGREGWADATVTLDRAGASAPGGGVMEHLGCTGDQVAARARQRPGDHPRSKEE